MEENVQEKRDDTREQKPHAIKAALKEKRKLGWGEIIFDFSVYGGISWILNEIVSTMLTSTIYKSQVKPGSSFLSKLFTPNGFAHKQFESTVDWLHTHTNPKKWGRTPFFLAAEMVVMTTGGHLMVLLSKPAEDRKGKIVRHIDNLLTGGRGEEDPGVKRAHEEMDAAPKQSWFSQVWGRVLVVVTAIAQHFSMGAEGDLYTAPTTRWLKDTAFEKYSNLKRIMTTGTRDAFSAHIPFTSIPLLPGASKEQRAVMKLNRAHSFGPDGTFRWMQPEEGKVAMAMGNTFGYVLIVSATMATLFFITSHIIAAVRQEKKKIEEKHEEKREEKLSLPPAQPVAAVAEPNTAKPERPTTTIAHAENHRTVAPQGLEVQHG